MPGPFEISTSGGTQQPIVADLGEAPRQGVLEEPRDECVHRKRQAPRLVRARVNVAEGDAAVLEPLQSMIGERDVIDVARELSVGLRAPADLLHVHGPDPQPDGGIDVLRHPGAG